MDQSIATDVASFLCMSSKEAKIYDERTPIKNK